MTDSSHNPYLRDAVLTAPPEQLQLLLYDGAIRFATQGRDAIQAGQAEKSYDLLTKAQKIMLELVNGLREEVDPPLVRQMASLYMFIYRKLVEANINKDPGAIDDALGLLAHQRETWVKLLDKLRVEQNGPGDAPDVQADGATYDAAPQAVEPADLPDPQPVTGATVPGSSEYRPLSVEG